MKDQFSLVLKRIEHERHCRTWPERRYMRLVVERLFRSLTLRLRCECSGDCK